MTSAAHLEGAGRIGLVGLGDFGLFCIRAFARSTYLDVVAVADPRPDLASRVTGCEVALYDDWRLLLEDDRVEVVHIATPPWTHAEIALAAASHGKSVLVEKPLALTLSDADAMIVAFEHAKLALGIDYVMRHQPAYRLLIDIAYRGLLGNIHRVALENGAQTVPKGHWFWDRAKSGGILVEHGVHFFDVFRQIAGEARSKATLDGGSRILAEVAYTGGAWGSFFHDFSLEVSVERLDASIIFDTGTAHITGWVPEFFMIRAIAEGNLDSWREIAGRYPEARFTAQDNIVTISLETADRSYAYERAVVRAAAQVVAAHRDPSFKQDVSTEDARASLALAIGAQELASI